MSSPSLITTTSSNLRLGISHDALEADHTDLTLRAEEALAGHEAGQAAGGWATNKRRAQEIC